MSAHAGEPVRISTARLRAQASGPASPPQQLQPARRDRTVPALVLSTAALLVLAAAMPGVGVLGPGSGPAEAAAVPGPSAPGAPTELPRTGDGSGAVAPVARPRGTSSCTAPCSTSQRVSATITPGPFEVAAAPASAVVRTDGSGTGRARIAGIRVTDLRGAGEGWTLSTRVVAVVDVGTGAAVPGVTVEVVPVCRRTAGPLTIESADRSVVGVGGTASLCIVPIASQGSLAGGLVSAYADVVVRGAPADTSVAVRLATSLT